MRKLLNAAIFSALLVSVYTTQAQMTLIPKAGISYANFAISDDMLDGEPSPNHKIGFVLGAALEIGINDQFAVQPELLFVQKGAMQKETDGGDEMKLTYNLNYLELPILAKVKFGEFYASAGPSFSFGIGGKATYKWDIQGDTGEESADIKFGDEPDNSDALYFDNALDVGIQVGVGGKLGPVVVDLRYGMGMTNLDDEPEGFPSDMDWKWKNQTFQLTVGFPIPVGQ